jgi:hypothetical protein
VRTRRRSAWSRAWQAAGALSGLGLAIGACEPLDIPLFPASADAGIRLVVDAGQLPHEADAAVADDAGSPEVDAGRAPAPCLAGATACEACVAASSCPVGRICHPRSGECVVPCSVAAPKCPAASTCSPLGVCVACVDDVQCQAPSARACDTDRGVCVECVDADDCTAEPLERPVCLPSQRCGCATNSDCPAGFCEAREGHCESE